MTFTPKCIFLVSGKRKSGKDFVSDALNAAIGPDESIIIRLAGIVKKELAKAEGLDLDKLLSTAEYKEKYRKTMASWAEEMR